MANPFHCNCHLSWFIDWMKTHHVITGNAVCESPHIFKGKTLTDLRGSDLTCEETKEIGCHMANPPCCSTQADKDLGNSCDPQAYCPPKCTCSGTVISCSKLKLATFPENIPSDTTELHLDGNSISEIPQDINRLKKLAKLDLSYNELVTLPDWIFSNLTQLLTLVLSYNKLECVGADTFARLSKLRLLSMHANNLSTLPFKAFKDLKSLTTLALSGNPLYCNCQLKWLSDYFKKDYVEPGIARCDGPSNMKNKMILTAPLHHFQCHDEANPVISAKCDACFKNPCLHGGSCSSVGFKDYSCACTSRYHGKKCEHEIDSCYGSPCLHGATCNVLTHGRYSCQCAVGFKGDRCQMNIDDCIDNQCSNHSSCVDLVQSYSCSCSPGYSGKLCDTKINYCHGEYNFCVNRGKCIDLITDYRCECVEGFTGKNCSKNINDCTSNVCQHGGTCLDGLNTYMCKCRPGYRGRNCDKIVRIPGGLYTGPHVCSDNDCQNLGICYQPYNSPEYKCRCSSGFSGKLCEKLTTVHLVHKDSYLQLMRIDYMPAANVSIVVATKHSTGIVLYVGRRQHVAVELFRGRIRVSFDIGNSPVSTMFSYEKVDDGHYHTLDMWIQRKNFTMRVDSHAPRTIVNEGTSEMLRVDDYLYVGGLPAAVSDRAFKRWHIRDGSSFHGCIKSMHLNGRQVDFHSSTNRNKVFSGCPSDDPVDPCTNNRCQNGRCKPKKRNPHGYRCRCRKGYSGEFCDRAPTCKELIYREIYVNPETKCRSRLRLKQRRCLGSCGRYCCKPRRIKTRKVRLHCQGGNSYVDDVAIVRRCSCRRCRSPRSRLKFFRLKRQ